LLVEDHPLVQGAIRAVIQSIAADIEVDVAGSLAEAFCLLNDRAPDLAIVDLTLPDACGTGTIQAFRRRAVGVPILATSAHIDAATATVLRSAGVTAIVAKTCTFDEWRATIRRVLAGDPRGGGATLRFGAVTGSRSGASVIRVPTPPVQAEGRVLSFTPRQRQVLKLLLLGMGNKEICRTTGMAPGTVKVHVSALLRTLRVSTRAQVVIAAQQAGIRLEDLR
jgi:DNA-binding NarL/FixJ family response regulator